MPRKKLEPKKCKIEGCENNLLAQGRCSMHYTRAVRSGEIVRKPHTIVNAGLCPVNDCGKPKYGSGFCQAHYEKFRKYGDPLGTAPRKTGNPCLTDGCSKLSVAFGMCGNCYQHYKKYGDSSKRSNRFNKRFEKIVDDKGYVLIHVKGHGNTRKSSGRVPEHRFVMSQFLGRALNKNENVHHKNGNRSDNRLENLELWVTSQPTGQRPLDLIDWARLILKTYAADEKKLKELEYRNQ